MIFYEKIFSKKGLGHNDFPINGTHHQPLDPKPGRKGGYFAPQGDYL